MKRIQKKRQRRKRRKLVLVHLGQETHYIVYTLYLFLSTALKGKHLVGYVSLGETVTAE